MEKNEKNFNHVLTLDNNKIAMITGVVEVISSTDKSVVARTENNTFQITGERLRVAKLILEEKLCHVEGDISKIEYNKAMKKNNFFKRLFK